MVPIAVLVLVILAHPVGGWMGMPVQFQPLAVSAVGIKLAMGRKVPKRMSVPFTPRHEAMARHIILLVDESVRPDYLRFSPGNAITPNLPKVLRMGANFGVAVSGSNCSNYSNAILRFTAQPHRMVESMHTYPTLWQWAKKAGFRTVYIDAQSIYLRSRIRLQNYMTMREAAQIDELVHFDDVAAAEVDMLALKRLEEILRKADRPLFVYVNKNGAHFPYDNSYPDRARRFQPTIRQAGGDLRAARVNSYLNAIVWSVDAFFARLLDRLPLEDTVIIYTSDHGQNLQPRHLPHCSLRNPDPREGLVPMLVITGKKDLLERFRVAATYNMNRTRHFHIAPAILRLMGYARDDLNAMYGPSLLDEIPASERTAFSHGDIFGLLTDKVRWKVVDTSKDYLEPEAKAHLRQEPERASR